jgi:hypothetical protein
MEMSRELAQASRRLADAQSARLAEVSKTRAAWATVVTVGPPATVSWRGATVTVSGKNAGYTPVVGDRVLLVADENDQLVIAFKVDGTP